MNLTAHIVIDMQEGFISSLEYRNDKEKKVVAGVCKEIQLARQKNRRIILVEYAHCGNTIDEVKQALKGYRYKTTIQKTDDDGSYDILPVLKRRAWRGIYRLRVCGVYTDQCVWKTVSGLVQQSPQTQITVVQPACMSDWDGSWTDFKRYKQVRLTKSQR